METPPPLPFANAFRLRWRGREEGPFPLEVIERRLAANEIGMLHEIEFEGAWIPLREFFVACRERERTDQLRREESERRAREEAERQAREQEAQLRERTLAEEKRKNDLLEAAVQSQKPAVGSPTGSGGLQVLGGLLIMGGIGVTIYFFAFFDQSVSTGSGGRVVNLSLMQDRQAGLIVGVSMVVVGTLMVLFSRRSKQN